MKKLSKFTRSALFISILLTLLLSMQLLTVSAAGAAPSNVVYNSSKVLVNGTAVAFDAYNIEGSNYFKLRDLAAAVIGTSKCFSVTWDAEKSAINLVSGGKYELAGGEFSKGTGEIDSFAKNTSIIYKDGKVADLTAYTINGNNYFKLRDVAGAFGIEVTFDSTTSTIGINSNSSGSSSDKKVVAPFKVINNTGVNIAEMYITPVSQQDWGTDILDGKGLKANEDIDLNFTFTADALKWDIKIVDSQKNSITLSGLDFSNCSTAGGEITLTYDFDKKIGTATLTSK